MQHLHDANILRNHAVRSGALKPRQQLVDAVSLALLKHRVHGHVNPAPQPRGGLESGFGLRVGEVRAAKTGVKIAQA